MKTLLLMSVVCLMVGCSTNAEFKRPEDVTALRASYTKASFVYSVFLGGTEVCQITALDRKDSGTNGQTAASLLADYGVFLDEDGCSIIPKASMP
jgi:hypothetical protein